ncbi:hypothetical protein BV22DRAFT_1131564 [Leucogyrophana mollusca]|uniref:Uncharacterized protein n=1 Tax=Leucogyrophana mollusca TaxID=85980 RepID=A0ACB8BAS5_9AGAM|nr:hypothetical protein BV22DRAFT_1131564 [Leucogyrophana mollusca]
MAPSQAALHTDSENGDQPKILRPPYKWNRTNFIRWSSSCLHVILVVLHLCLVSVAVCHAEHRAIVPITSTSYILTTMLSASLQAFYTLYTALLVYITQRLALLYGLSQHQPLTATHDTIGAWAGIGSAFCCLWEQTKLAALPLQVFAITTYLTCVTVLHITSSSIIQLQNFNDTVTASIPTALGWPDPSWFTRIEATALNATVSDNLSPVGAWETITFAVPFVRNRLGISTAGLSQGVVYDVPFPNKGTGNATVGAMVMSPDCALVAGGRHAADDSLIAFSTSNLSDYGYVSPLNNTFSLNSIPWKDQVLYLSSNNINFVVTTAINESMSPIDDVVIPVEWAYLHTDPTTNLTLYAQTRLNMYLVSCNVTIKQVRATIDVQSNQLIDDPTHGSLFSYWTTVAPTFSSSAPAMESWLSGLFEWSSSVGDISIFSADCNGTSTSPSSHSCGYQPTATETYLMQLIGLNASQINPYLATGPPPLKSSDTTPSFTLSVDQMENALAQTLAAAIWTAGSLGESGGGFDRLNGTAQTTELVLRMRLNISWIPLSFALTASIFLLALSVQLTGFQSNEPRKHNTMHDAGVLELMWLASRSPDLQNAVNLVDHPNTDNLRSAGMFAICLADVGAEGLRTGHDNRCANKGSSFRQVAMADDELIIRRCASPISGYLDSRSTQCFTG